MTVIQLQTYFLVSSNMAHDIRLHWQCIRILREYFSDTGWTVQNLHRKMNDSYMSETLF